MKPEIKLKRIYDEPNSEDGFRVFVDRLWARGVTKDTARIDVWAKELTPSNELRKWFHEDTSRQADFEERYVMELEERKGELEVLIESLQSHSTITLVTATKDLVDGHAVILQTFLDLALHLHSAK